MRERERERERERKRESELVIKTLPNITQGVIIIDNYTSFLSPAFNYETERVLWMSS
jgi:hypothetical protein